MVHWISTLFFLGLIVALAMVLEFTLRDHWVAFAAALRGAPAPDREMASSARSRAVPLRRAAA